MTSYKILTSMIVDYCDKLQRENFLFQQGPTNLRLLCMRINDFKFTRTDISVSVGLRLLHRLSCCIIAISDHIIVITIVYLQGSCYFLSAVRSFQKKV